MKVGRNLFVSTCVAVFLLFGAANSFAQEEYHGVRTIVIDPGHGGKDPGCVFGNVREKDIVLSVSLELGKMIKEQMPGVKVVYTRDKDVFIPLDRRGKIANDAKADLFISVHVNATDKKEGPSGALTLIMGKENEGRNLDMAMKENQVISYEDDYTTKYKEYLSGSSEMFIIYSLTQYVNIEQSISFANTVQNHFKASTPMPDKGIRRQKLLVLWYTTMPGVLVELGFINNEHDRKALVSAKGQKQMATALFEAVKEYKQRVESKAKPLLVEGEIYRSIDMPSGEKPVVHDAVPPSAQQAQTTDKPKNATTSKPAAATGKGAKGVVYRVQILSTMKKLPSNSSELKEYRGKVTENYDGTRYRYSVGECKTYAEVLELQANVRKSFPGAFAVAFRDGRQITVPEARKLTD